jgi:hypothetical protein
MYTLQFDHIDLHSTFQAQFTPTLHKIWPKNAALALYKAIKGRYLKRFELKFYIMSGFSLPAPFQRKDLSLELLSKTGK